MADYKTPSELLNEHPEVAEVWNATQLGYLLHLKLIAGYKTRRSSKLLVNDVLRMLKIRNDHERELQRF
jgi:hypothetical protein